MSVQPNGQVPRRVALKRRVSSALRSPAPAAAVTWATKGVVRTGGLRIDTNAACVADKTRAALFWGLYESAERRMISRNPPQAELIIDLGASLGVVSAAAARYLPPGGRIICVEANPDLVALAARNVLRNVPGVQVDALHGAIDYGSSTGDVVSFASATQHTASALSDQDGSNGFSAPVIRLRDIAPTGQAYDLLCDVEGAEVGLLLEEGEALAGCQRLYIEAHRTRHDGREYDVEDIHGLVAGHGFQMLDRYGNSSVWARSTGS